MYCIKPKWHFVKSDMSRLVCSWLMMNFIADVELFLYINHRLEIVFIIHLNSSPAGGNFCHLLIFFANSLDPDQAWHYVRPDLDTSCLALWWYSWKKFMKNLILKTISKQWKKEENLAACKAHLYSIIMAILVQMITMKNFANCGN